MKRARLLSCHLDAFGIMVGVGCGADWSAAERWEPGVVAFAPSGLSSLSSLCTIQSVGKELQLRLCYPWQWASRPNPVTLAAWPSVFITCHNSNF